METINGKEPIVNGGYNKQLTLNEMLQFSNSVKCRLIWNMQVGASGGYYKLPENVKPFEYLYTYNHIENCNESELNEALTKVFNAVKSYQLQIKLETLSADWKTGVKIKKAQKELGFGGNIELSFGKLLGYISEGGRWNNFNPSDVERVLNYYENSLPKTDYGLNNPNTGTDNHVWTTKNDYIFIEVKHVNDKILAQWKQWFNEVAEPKADQMKCDSIRLNIEEIEDNLYTDKRYMLTVSFWWD